VKEIEDWTTDRILAHVLPLVQQALTDELGAVGGVGECEQRRVAAQLSAIRRFHDNDAVAALGAVVSAISEFRNQNAGTSRGVGAAGEAVELAVDLVRVAYNRMQRQRRRQQRMLDEVARGTGPGGERLLEQYPAEDFSEFPAQLREVVDFVLGSLPEQERQVVSSRFEGLTQQMTAERLGIHRAAVQRIEARFRDAVGKLLESERRE
jgi:RNA polymerase sigma factor (sigma-70 family)